MYQAPKPMLERVAPLQEDPQLGKRPYAAERRSNCFGTALFALGHHGTSRPEYVSPTQMKRYLAHCTEGSGPLLVHFAPSIEGPREVPWHAAVLLSATREQAVVFDQPRCGAAFRQRSFSHEELSDRFVRFVPPGTNPSI